MSLFNFVLKTACLHIIFFITVPLTNGVAQDAKYEEKVDELALKMSPSMQRRMLKFVNMAYSQKDLMKDPQVVRKKFEHGHSIHTKREVEKSTPRGFPSDMAKTIIENRPLYGFDDVRDCFKLYSGSDMEPIKSVVNSLGPEEFGQWNEVVDVENENAAEPVMHAAMLHTGKVLLIPNNTNTVLWDPATNGIQVLSGSNTGLRANLFCSGHAFLSDGRLLAVGGGGGGWGEATSIQGWIFDPVAEKWKQTGQDMNFKRWYPTVVNLGREPGALLIASGWMETGNDPAPQMEIYSESSDTFAKITAEQPTGDLSFRPTYPGLHVLPGGEILHVPVGYENCQQAPSGAISDPTALFSFSGSTTGSWKKFENNHRVKGMSVLLLSQSNPFVRGMVIGGGDFGKSGTAQTINLSSFSPTWDPIFPILESRVHPNVVLLPDGDVFICGGIEGSSQPPPNGGRCEMFDPKTGSLVEMDEMIRSRHYHSAAILLPTGQVMAAGGAGPNGCTVSQQNTIEVFDPPYLFKGDRPTIASVPSTIEHGQLFNITSPDADSIGRVVLARPMAVTHQTDSEQRIIPMEFKVPNNDTIEATAPGGAAPNPIAPQGYYMLFVLNNEGVPSISKWIKLE